MKIRHRLAGGWAHGIHTGLYISGLGREWIQGRNGQWVYEENQEL